MSELTALIRKLEQATKDDFEVWKAALEIHEYVIGREVEQFNRGYEMAKRHFTTGKVADLTEIALDSIDRFDGYKSPPISAM